MTDLWNLVRLKEAFLMLVYAASLDNHRNTSRAHAMYLEKMTTLQLVQHKNYTLIT